MADTADFPADAADFPEVRSQQGVLDFYLAEAREVLAEHHNVVESLTELLCEQGALPAEQAQRWLDDWAIQSRKAAYEGRFRVHDPDEA